MKWSLVECQTLSISISRALFRHYQPNLNQRKVFHITHNNHSLYPYRYWRTSRTPRTSHFIDSRQTILEFECEKWPHVLMLNADVLFFLKNWWEPLLRWLWMEIALTADILWMSIRKDLQVNPSFLPSCECHLIYFSPIDTANGENAGELHLFCI